VRLLDGGDLGKILWDPSLLLFLFEELETVVQCRDDLSLRDAETCRWRDVTRAIFTDWCVLTASAAHRQAKRLADLLGFRVSAV